MQTTTIIKDRKIFSISSFNVAAHIILILFCLLCLLPILLIISISFSNETEIMKHGYSLIPLDFTARAYELIFADKASIFRAYMTTAVVTVLGTVIGMCLTVSLAYGISRKDFKYKKVVAFYVYFTMLFNGGLVPSYILIASWLGMKNTIFALFVPYLVSAWFVLLMKGFLQSVPMDIIESAKIDGAREFGIFLKIVVPISKPGIATLSLFYILVYWNDWFLNLLYIDGDKYVTLQYMLYRIMSNIDYLNSGIMNAMMVLRPVDLPTITTKMAMCILAAGPMLIVFPFFQKYFTKGLTVGSIKG